MAGMLINNVVYFYNINNYVYLLDFLLGNSVINTFLLYICSYVFQFCKWHRLIITANFINLVIAGIDATYKLPVSDVGLLCLYWLIASIFIIYSTITHIQDERKN